MSLVEQRRAGFEAWVRKHNDSIREEDEDGPESIRLDRQGGVYIWANAESAWFAWNAALDSVEIEIPDICNCCYQAEDAADACREAIEAAGLKVKP